MSKKSNNIRSKPALANAKNTRREIPPKQIDQKQSMIEKPLFLIILILCLTFIAFFPTLKNGFIPTWDDGAYVINNQSIQNLNQSSLKEIFTTTVASSYVPLPILTFAVEYKIFGLNPFIFHFSNLILHLLCTFLVFQILRMLKLKPVYAAIGAMIFGVHPMHVESIAWIAERKDLLCCLFCFASIIFYFKYLILQKKTLVFYFLSLSLFIFALFSKISAVMLPLSFLLIDYYFERPLKGKVLIEKVPFFILSLIFGIAEILIFQKQGALNATEIVSISDQVFMGFYALSAYIIKFFVPFPLSAIYPWLSIPGHSLPFLYYISPFFILVLGFLIYRATRKTRAILFGSLFFLFNIILMFQAQILTQGIGFLADRFSYVAYLGICFLAGWFSEWLIRNKKELKTLALGVLFFIILIFTVLSFNRTKIWENDFTLWNDVIEKYPDNIYKSYANRGIAFTSIEQWDNAINDFTRVIAMDPKYGWGYVDRGMAYQHTGQWDKSIDDFSMAIEINTMDFDAYAGRALSYGVLGKFDKAITDFSTTLQINPEYSKGYSNRGLTYANLGYLDKAIADYSKAIELDPEYKDAWSNRSLAYGKLNQWDNAITDGLKAIRIDPRNAGLYDNVGYFYLAKGDYDHGEEQFRKAHELDSKSFDPLLGLAIIYYTKGDKGNAKQFLVQAKNIEPRLNNGMAGINELENMGYFKPSNIQETLKNLLAELN
jgi:tetratricopeptide (TPR) repeat protein